MARGSSEIISAKCFRHLLVKRCPIPHNVQKRDWSERPWNIGQLSLKQRIGSWAFQFGHIALISKLQREIRLTQCLPPGDHKWIGIIMQGGWKDMLETTDQHRIYCTCINMFRCTSFSLYTCISFIRSPYAAWSRTSDSLSSSPTEACNFGTTSEPIKATSSGTYLGHRSYGEYYQHVIQSTQIQESKLPSWNTEKNTSNIPTRVLLRFIPAPLKPLAEDKSNWSQHHSLSVMALDVLSLKR